MRFFSRPSKPPNGPPTDEQAVILHLKLADDDFGPPGEVEALNRLGDSFRSVVDSAGIGEYDGNEFGAGWGVFWLYGPSADSIADAVTPLVLSASPRAGSYIVRRYGGVETPRAAERRQDIGTPPLN